METESAREAGVHTWDPHDYERHSAAQEDWARRCLARLRLGGAERILDIGCGDGRITAELAAMVPHGRVVGIDSSPEMIAHASARHGGPAHAGLSFAIGDATSLSYSSHFDVVVSFNCLHWVGDQRAVLAGITRALAPGGRTFLHFGGRGNVAGLRMVIEGVTTGESWRALPAGFGFPWCFPDAAP
ncbi:MAG TPA: methyltransferase domain-containing protein [Thermoleophilia bacterium]|nr:methyltransferase domain-containing protein [Thermoleophilia bacterium]